MCLQRIGRCHRYGQKHDVVVVNFVDRSNEADARVYELLEQKFQLFDGVFGASDEVLGAIQSSASLEGRIKLTYESGPYDIDRPTNVAMIFAAAVQRKFREVNGIDGVDAPDGRKA